MKSTKILIAAAVCLAMISTASWAGSKSGATHELHGTVEFYSMMDSSLIVKDKVEDTIKITPNTKFLMGKMKMSADDLKPDMKVNVWYAMKNGQKLATKVTGMTMKTKPN
jgi:hypothetical protein